MRFVCFRFLALQVFCSSAFSASISRTEVAVDYVGMCKYRGWGKERCGASRPEALPSGTAAPAGPLAPFLFFL